MNSPGNDQTSVDKLVAAMGLKSSEFEARKDFAQFTDEDARILKEIAPTVRARRNWIVDQFYENITKHPDLLKLIDDAGSNMDALKDSQKVYLDDLVSGNYDNDYMERRIRIGAVHCRIGLGPRWYLGSYAVYFNLISSLIHEHFRFRSGKRLKAIQALNSILLIDAQIAIETYIHSLVYSISVTIEEISGSVSMQATGASEQAAAVTQTSASLAEIKETTSQTLDKATSLSEAAERTQMEGAEGIEGVSESIDSVRSIRDKVEVISQTIVTLSEQNKRIGEITTVVNNLAQQSKMLAINASIEAAKAGESGKGFAVVAEEVSNLADQSEEATQQVTKILDEIQNATDKAVMA
ncbi:MAG: globin-coupled sensor protein, partial [Rhodospirillaceae bacterium]|nr:globin-coupled sensor protein [Rhodospirillaceae bacterium]